MSPKSIGKNNKSRKKLGEFHKRLILLLETDVPEWARKLHVSQSVIRDRWFKGGFPGSDKLLAISRAANVSCDWLLTGFEKENFFGSAWPDEIKNACKDALNSQMRTREM